MVWLSCKLPGNSMAHGAVFLEFSHFLLSARPALIRGSETTSPKRDSVSPHLDQALLLQLKVIHGMVISGAMFDVCWCVDSGMGTSLRRTLGVSYCRRCAVVGSGTYGALNIICCSPGTPFKARDLYVS